MYYLETTDAFSTFTLLYPCFRLIFTPFVSYHLVLIDVAHFLITNLIKIIFY